jgi:hypothetical protein
MNTGVTVLAAGAALTPLALVALALGRRRPEVEAVPVCPESA